MDGLERQSSLDASFHGLACVVWLDLVDDLRQLHAFAGPMDRRLVFFLLARTGRAGGFCTHRSALRTHGTRYKRRAKCHRQDAGKKESCRHRQWARARTLHHLLDSSRQIRAADAGDECQGSAEVEAAHLEDAFSVAVTVGSHLQHLFIARELACIDEPGSKPPDQRMEPEHVLDHYLDERTQVVP